MKRVKRFGIDFLKSPKKVFVLSIFIFFCAAFFNVAVNLYSIPDAIKVAVGMDNEITVFSAFRVSVTNLDSETVAASYSLDERVTGIEDPVELTLSGENYSTADLDALSLDFLGLPIKKIGIDVLPSDVVPCGKTVGVRINTQGVMVLGTGAIEGEGTRPSDGKLRAGDLIVALNGRTIDNKGDFIRTIEDGGGADIEVTVKRNGTKVSVPIKPVVDKDGKYKIGAWIRDGTQGIGTVTYYDPKTKAFGALGHGILDVDTKKLMTVRKGEIMESRVVSVKRGKKGFPGELEGDVNSSIILGTITANTPVGLYGYFSAAPSGISDVSLPVAHKSEVHAGPAKIRSNVSETETKEYDIFIESVNIYGADESKGMVVRITDRELLSKTNGIVQGMSGSPILQDGKIIGAVTHVFVQSPNRGYGIFIENMLKAFR